MHNLKACEGFFCLLRTLAGNVKIIITENWFIINYLNFLSFENGNLFCSCIPKPHLIGNLALLEINICTYMRNIFPKCAFSFTCCLDLCSIHLRHSTVMPCLMLCAVMISRGNPRYKCIQHVHGNLDWQISVLSLIPVPSKFVIASLTSWLLNRTHYELIQTTALALLCKYFLLKGNTNIERLSSNVCYIWLLGLCLMWLVVSREMVWPERNV